MCAIPDALMLFLTCGLNAFFIGIAISSFIVWRSLKSGAYEQLDGIEVKDHDDIEEFL